MTLTFTLKTEHPGFRLEDGPNACSGNLTLKVGAADADLTAVWDAICNGNDSKISPDTICRQLHCGARATQSFDCRDRSRKPTLTCNGNVLVPVSAQQLDCNTV